MKKEHIISIFSIIIIWFIASILINNDILLPNPVEVIKLMSNQIIESSFYKIVGLSILRMIVGIIYSFMFSFVIALLTDRYNFLYKIFEPIETLLKTIPNISYIIIALIWLGQEGSVTLVCFLVVFPIMYTNISLGLKMKDSELNDVAQIFPETYFETLIKVTIPLLLPQLIIAIKSSISLGFKVAIMAEILGQVPYGIGKQLYYAKINLDMISLFAWTLWIIIISGFIDHILGDFMIKLKNKIF